MVSRFENLICLCGIGAFYSFATYKFFTTKKKFNNILHQEIISNANHLMNEINPKNLKFVETHDQKLLFLLGLDNKESDLENILLISRILENFTPNFLLFEKDYKIISRQFYNIFPKIAIKFAIDDRLENSKGDNLSSKEMNNDINLKEQNYNNVVISFLANKIEEELYNHFQKDYYDDKDELYNTFNKLKEFEKEKDFYMNLISLFTQYKAQKMLQNCTSIHVGVDFSVLKTILKKRIILNSESKNQNEGKKNPILSINERLKVKKELFETNCKYDIYNDLLNLMKEEILEINQKSLEKINPNLEKIFNDLVIDEFNQIIINNISDNKQLYIGLFLVNSKRLDSLYDAILEQKRITESTSMI